MNLEELSGVFVEVRERMKRAGSIKRRLLAGKSAGLTRGEVSEATARQSASTATAGSNLTSNQAIPNLGSHSSHSPARLCFRSSRLKRWMLCCYTRDARLLRILSSSDYRAMRSNKRPRSAGNHGVFRVVSFPPASSDPSADASSGRTQAASRMPLTPSEPSPPTSKIAIPRVSQLRSYGNQRVKRACIECREQKTKCNGKNPCGRCTSMDLQCVYVDGKREVTEKRLHELERQVQAYDRLLKELQPRVDSQDKGLISRTRAQVCFISRLGY